MDQSKTNSLINLYNQCSTFRSPECIIHGHLKFNAAEILLFCVNIYNSYAIFVLIVCSEHR